MLKKIGDLTTISSSTQSTPRSPLQSPLLRRTHTAPELTKVEEVKEKHRAARTSGLSSFLQNSNWKLTTIPVAAFEPLPEHNESHVGPYGVEVPLHGDFVVKVTEVTVAEKVDAEKGSYVNPDHTGDVPGEISVEPKQG